MKSLVRRVCLVLYYGIAQHLPGQPFPGWMIGTAFRYLLVRGIFARCGRAVQIKRNVYFGHGSQIEVGDHVRIGKNTLLDWDTIIGDYSMIAQEVIMQSAAHEFEDRTRPIQTQGAKPRKPIVIGRDVWVGARAIILPGTHIGDGAVIAAGAIVKGTIPPFAIVAGVPGRVVRFRGSRITADAVASS